MRAHRAAGQPLCSRGGRGGSVDRAWSSRFEAIRSELARSLHGVPYRAIEHVGSTAVPGLAAKPVIDVDVIVERGRLDNVISALVAGGYEHRGDLGIADRHAFRAPDDVPRRNVYVVVDGSLALRNHLAVRDALRTDPRLRDEYAALKLRLAEDVDDMAAYLEGKTELLVGILARAGFNDADLDLIRRANGTARI